MAASTGLWTAAVAVQIAVAPVAAVVATRYGSGVGFWLNAGSFALSALALRRLWEPERPRPVSVSSPFAQAAVGEAAARALPAAR